MGMGGYLAQELCIGLGLKRLVTVEAHSTAVYLAQHMRLRGVQGRWRLCGLVKVVHLSLIHI